MYDDPRGLNPFTAIGDAAGDALYAYHDLDRNRDDLAQSGNGNNDKCFHYKARCQACSAQNGIGGNLSSLVASPGKELVDFADRVSDREVGSASDALRLVGDALNDIAANNAGRTLANSGAQCAAACNLVVPPAGLPPRFSSEIAR